MQKKIEIVPIVEGQKCLGFTFAFMVSVHSPYTTFAYVFYTRYYAPIASSA